MMFQQLDDFRSRKRAREDDEVFSLQGSQQHPPKRHIASLPLRRSLENKKRVLPISHTSRVLPQSPTFADITPTGSDSEDIHSVNGPQSFFSPWSSPVDNTPQNSQPPSSPDKSQSTQIQETEAYSDDLEMTDTFLLYPGQFQSDPSTGIAGRIPTPIHSHFSSHIRTGNIADQNMISSDTYTSSNASRAPTRTSRRLPSPISEDGAVSPSSLLQSLGDVQMEVEEAANITSDESKAVPRKGHTRSKHSLRTWGDPGTEIAGLSLRKGFSMGYRSDCEKCRMKVPGHFSHVITY